VPALEEITENAIKLLYPDYIQPDHDNYLSPSTQYKSPDFAVLQESVLIELKSRKAIDDGKYSEKLVDIAQSQSVQINGFGLVNFGCFIRRLPDPQKAERKLLDYMMNKIMKSAREANAKFSSYEKHTEKYPSARITVISDNLAMISETYSIEYYLARKLSSIDSMDDSLSHTDAIIFLKDPKFVMDRDNSYWFKCICKRTSRDITKENVLSFSKSLHDFLILTDELSSSAQNFRIGKYRPVLA
jgi:hypothetical protein